MTVISAPYDVNVDDVFVDLKPVFGVPLHLKYEGINLAGSVKLKAALSMVLAAESGGILSPGDVLVESSSGNLGVALSMIAAHRGYGFVCVTDSRCNPASKRMMEAYGARVLVISRPDKVHGLLGARIEYVRRLCEYDPNYVWLNQYVNEHNWLAHYRTTAPSVAAEFPELDVLFVGAGTTGTLMGCARYFREQQRPVKIVAVDSVGSVTFGGPALTRHIPGLGAGIRPQMLDRSLVDDVVMVPEQDTLERCHAMAKQGFLFGGSTGTVVSGALRWLAEHPGSERLTTVALSPDQGDRYLDSVYDPEWVEQHFGSPGGWDGGAAAPARPALVTSGV
ncbi:2,3-diaminopropionate biosynthesis protein SbnA [Streptomyces sp. NPDC091287]|uniref:2,3-diaminopropionate biosynthesis protein SbnA n=1 Tax=Streptomyces sp. NPDC091287 TaxID=3365988 RepID=UPI0038187FE3